MYKMTPSINEGMVPQDEYIVPHSYLPDMMGRGPPGRESIGATHPRQTTSPLRAVRLVKKSRKKAFPYMCHVLNCGEKFFNNKGLDTHLKLHLGVKPFTCNFCGKVCQTESKLKAHQTSHANDGVKPVCDICERSFSSRSSLNKHKKMLHKPKPYICPQCHSGFEEHRYMAIHAKQAHNLDLPLELEDTHLSCTMDFSTNNFNSSNTAESSKDLFKESCSLPESSLSSPVGAVPSDPRDLQEKTMETVADSSIINRRGNIPINCELCTSTFPSVAYLEQHMAVHINEKILMCHSCTLDFTNHEDLANHMKMHGTESEGHYNSFTHTETKCPQMSDKYACASCKEHFMNLGSLKRHQAKGHCTSALNNGV